MPNGDLTRRITRTRTRTRTDEFGGLLAALQHMNESLGRVVGNVRASTDSISTASAEIASGNADLSTRTEQTASNLQQDHVACLLQARQARLVRHQKYPVLPSQCLGAQFVQPSGELAFAG